MLPEEPEMGPGTGLSWQQVGAAYRMQPLGSAISNKVYYKDRDRRSGSVTFLVLGS